MGPFDAARKDPLCAPAFVADSPPAYPAPASRSSAEPPHTGRRGNRAFA